MEERFDSAAIIVRSVVSTLTALIVAIGLILGIALAASPRFAYDFYVTTGNARGIYVGADKLAERADRTYRALGGDARAYNVDERLPAFRLAARCGTAYYGGDLPERVRARMEAVVTDGDFAAYAHAVDAANMMRSTRGAHVYVTGEEDYLCGAYVRMLYPEAPDAAAEFVSESFADWLAILAGGVPVEIVAAGGMIAYLECAAGTGAAADVGQLFTDFDAVCGRSEFVEATAAEERNVLPALHVAKNCMQLYRLFGRLGAGTDGAEAAATAWKGAFDALTARYTAAT